MYGDDVFAAEFMLPLWWLIGGGLHGFIFFSWLLLFIGGLVSRGEGVCVLMVALAPIELGLWELESWAPMHTYE